MAKTDGSAVAKLCKYCKGGVDSSNPKNWKCVKCNSLFHKACALRVKSLRIVSDQESLVNCCEGEVAAKLDVAGDSGTIEAYKIEVMYLRMLLQEKDARINELCKLNQLLEEKVSIKSKQMDERICAGSSERNKDGDSSCLGRAYSNSVLEIKHSSMNDKLIDPTDTSQVIRGGHEKLVNKQKDVMNEIIGLVNDSADAEEVNILGESGDFVKVTHRKKNRAGKSEVKSTDRSKMFTHRRERPSTRGSAQVSAEDSFKARPSKMWLYVGRAMPTVTGTVVEEYMVRKCGITDKNEVEVKELPFVGKSRAFQVGIDPGYFEKVNCGEFWPKGIIIRKFYFGFRKPIGDEDLKPTEDFAKNIPAQKESI